jgi:glycosyltransferase involved in cell wall biosynthesis
MDSYHLSQAQKNKQLLVTIITIVRNGENVLERTINSVLNQTYENIEYIVIDGGSKDGTIDIITKFESQVSHWISESDEGISDAMNKGIKLSSGILIQHLHAGDEFVSEETVANIVSSYIAESWRWCLGNQLLTNFSGEVVYRFSPPKFSNWLLRVVNTIPHPTVFAERSLFEEAGCFDISYECAMDYHLWLRFSLISKPKQFDFDIAKFLVGGKSANIQLALSEEFRKKF